MTELRIKIKEVVEDWGKLPVGLNCMIYVETTDPSPLQQSAKYELNNLGYVRGSKRYNEQKHAWEGLFKTETIRDATPEEEDAWWYLFKAKGCQKRLNARNAGDCDCIISGECINTLHRREKAETIHKGKEVILELVE